MAETVDEISIDWKDESGQQLVKQVKKEVLTSGAWSTIMFMYQDLDKKTGEFGPKKIRVARYQKRGGKFIPQSKFNISSARQAKTDRRDHPELARPRWMRRRPRKM